MPDLDEDLLLDDEIPEDDPEGEGENGEPGSGAGQLDDEGGGEAGRQAGQEGEGEARVAPSRGEKRFQKLSNEAKEAREHAARVERELNELRAKVDAKPAEREESPEAEAARLALMTTEERLEYKLDKAEKRQAREMARLQFQSFDQADKAAYAAKAASDPRLKKYAADVEATLAATRREGRDIGFTREQIAAFVIGQKILARQEADIARQRNQGQRRIGQQRAAAPNDRSDRTTQRQRGGGGSRSDLEKRLLGPDGSGLAI